MWRRTTRSRTKKRWMPKSSEASTHSSGALKDDDGKKTEITPPFAPQYDNETMDDVGT